MKQLIYSTGIFNTELQVFEPEEDSYGDDMWCCQVKRQRFELRKISYCLTRYEIEEGDKEYLDQLSEDADEATSALSMNLMSIVECQGIVDKYRNFASMYDKAMAGQEATCENVKYVEIADETNYGCYAEYRFNDGVTESIKKCKIGEPFTIKIMKE